MSVAPVRPEPSTAVALVRAVDVVKHFQIGGKLGSALVKAREGSIGLERTQGLGGQRGRRRQQ